MIRCVIVDDSEPFRTSARRLLSGQGVAVVATAADSRQAIRAVQEQEPDVVLIDVGLAAESGFELATRLAGRAVILVSSVAAEDLAELLDASPAIGYLPKQELSGGAISSLLRRWEPGHSGRPYRQSAGQRHVGRPPDRPG